MNEELLAKLYFIVVLLFSASIHEVAHAVSADKLGDPTARYLGRITLNPIAHIDLIGTIILPIFLAFSGSGFMFAYAKPVPINPLNFRNYKRDMAITAFAGPLSNILLAFLSAFLLIPIIIVSKYKIVNILTEPLIKLFLMLIQANIFLAFFNLVPIPPLDGSKVLAGFLPDKEASAFLSLGVYGMWFIILLLMLDNVIPILDYLVRIPSELTFKIIKKIIYSGVMLLS